MFEHLLNQRIFHVSLIIAVGVFVEQFLQWQQSIWILISILAIIGPFRPGMTIDKAKQRMLGTVLGLLLTILFNEFYRHFPTLIIPCILIIIFLYAYVMFDPDHYKYMIAITTVFICTNYTYMNPPVLYSEFNLFWNRLICVFTGVAIYLFFELLIFRPKYNNAIAVIEHDMVNEATVKVIEDTLKLYSENALNPEKINQQISILVAKKTSQLGHKKSMLNGFSQQDDALALVNFYIDKIDDVVTTLGRLGSNILLSRENDIENDIEALNHYKNKTISGANIE